MDQTLKDSRDKGWALAKDLQKQVDLLRNGLKHIVNEGSNINGIDPIYLVEMAEHVLEEHEEFKKT
jgi:hypothetical protein